MLKNKSNQKIFDDTEKRYESTYVDTKYKSQRRMLRLAAAFITSTPLKITRINYAAFK